MPVNNIYYFWEDDIIRLRPLKPSDWELKYEEFKDTSSRRLLEYGVDLPSTDEKYREAIEELTYFKKAGEGILFFGIETLAGEFAGWLNLYTGDRKNGVFSFSIGIFKPFRQKGYAQRALKIALKYGFYELRFQKCNSACISINEASIKLHKKLGFKEEGIRRREIYTNGQYYDNVLFGITREEFDEINDLGG